MAALIIRTVLWYSICNYAKKLESIGAFIPASVLIIGFCKCNLPVLGQAAAVRFGFEGCWVYPKAP